MTTPRVSVVMPVFNGERYLAEAVESVLGQAFADFECIIVDDGSTDRSAAILERYAERDARVRVIRQANAGITRSLNRGLAESRGELIARMDADDISLPERFGRQAAYMEAHPDCVALGGQGRKICPRGLVFADIEAPADHAQIEHRLLHGGGYSIIHPALMVRREAVERIGGYREEFPVAQDRDLFLRLAMVGRLANVGEVLIHRRYHLEMTGQARHREQAEVARRVVAEALEARGMRSNGQESSGWAPKPPAHQLRGWAWNALRQGARGAAFGYAVAALRHEPVSMKTYRLLACVARGY